MDSRPCPRVAIMLLAAHLLPSAVGAQISGIRADTDAASIAAVTDLEFQLCDLLVRGAWRSYATHLTDDYVRVLPGKVQGKAEVLDEIRTSRGKILSMTPEKIQVRMFGDTAIANIELVTRLATPDGAVVTNYLRPTKVFVRRHGRWYLAQLTASPVK